MIQLFYFMVNYVVCLTWLANFKVLILTKILDFPCPKIFNIGAGQQCMFHEKIVWVSISQFLVIKMFPEKKYR